MSCHRLLLVLITLTLLVVVPACNNTERKRPYGLLRLVPYGTLIGVPESDLTSKRMVIRWDSRGFSGMSSLCTYDLSPLEPSQDEKGEFLWRSRYNASTYRRDGSVVSGPATKNLPYFKLEIADGENPTVQDTLYAEIGVEVDANWRLPVPQVAVPLGEEGSE